MRATAREAGLRAEEQARRYLEARGLSTQQRNFRCRRGEIDLVMRDGDTLVFVEVRYRADATFGSAAESVTAAKQRRLGLAARHFLERHGGAGAWPCRFDVVAISGGAGTQLRWIRDAFQPPDT